METKRQSKFTIIDITELRERLENNESAGVIQWLKDLESGCLSKKFSLTEQDMLVCLSRSIEILAMEKKPDKLSDKLTGIFWDHGDEILRKRMVIQ